MADAEKGMIGMFVFESNGNIAWTYFKLRCRLS